MDEIDSEGIQAAMGGDGDIRTIPPGVLFERAGKLWYVCPKCLKLVRVDKPIIGSMHLCVADDEDGEG